MENPIFLPRFTLSKPSCSSGAAGVSSFRPVFQLLGDCSQLSWISARHPVFTFQTFSSSSLCQIPKPVSSPNKDPSLEKSLVIETPVITLLAVPIPVWQLRNKTCQAQLQLWNLRKGILPGRTKGVTQTAPVRTAMLAQLTGDPGSGKNASRTWKQFKRIL